MAMEAPRLNWPKDSSRTLAPKRLAGEERPSPAVRRDLARRCAHIVRGVRTGNRWSRCLGCTVFCTDSSLLDYDAGWHECLDRVVPAVRPQEAHAASSSHRPD